MNLGVILLLGLACAIGMLLDMSASIFGLIAFAQAEYWVERLFVAGLGAIVTLFVAGTKYVVRGQVHWLLMVMWGFCMLVDLVTSVFSLAHFMVEHKTLRDAVTLTPQNLWAALLDDPKQGVLAAILVVVFNASTIGGAYCLDAAPQTSASK